MDASGRGLGRPTSLAEPPGHKKIPAMLGGLHSEEILIQWETKVCV